MKVDQWNLEPPPGFQGLHPHLPLEFYYRHLPHWRQDGATYFVTFRLADSLPQTKLNELSTMKQEFAAKHGIEGADWESVLRSRSQAVPRKEWEAFNLAQMRRVENWLDQGMGSCPLKRPDVAANVVAALHHFDGKTYELGSYVVMPNHVHVVIRPLSPQTNPLEKILQSRKLRTSREINAILGRTGTLWQEESFDRIIRDEEHLYRCLQYIGENPRKAGLNSSLCPRWIRPSWEECGWRFNQE